MGFAKTEWNPSGLENNCGFCAISYALQQQRGTLLNADLLYEMTLQRLGIERRNNIDPIPRRLIFPGPDVINAGKRGGYEELEHCILGPSGYTIWAVASHAGLSFQSGDKVLLNALIEFDSRSRTKWTLDDFVNERLEKLEGRSTFEKMKGHVEKSLKGTSIIGSISAAHFMNMSFDQEGEWKLFDPQNGVWYDGPRAKVALGQIDLFERVLES